MKKSISIIIAIMMSMMFAYAENVITIDNVTTNPATYTIDINGTAQGNEEIVITVYQAEENDLEIPLIKSEFVYQEQITANSEYSHSFKLNKASGYYMVVVSGEYTKTPVFNVFYFINDVHLEQTLQSLNSAKNAVELQAVLSVALDELGIDKTEIKLLGSPENFYQKLFLKYSGTITKANLEEYRKTVKEVAVCEALSQGKITDIMPYKEQLGIEKLDVYLDFSKLTAIQKSQVATNLKDFIIDSYEVASNCFTETAIAGVVSGKSALEMENILKKYEEKIDIKDILLKVINLSPSSKHTIYSSLSGVKLARYQDIKTILTSEYNNINDTPITTGGGGGNGGGIGGSFQPNNQNIEELPIVTPIVEKIFNDLSDAEWAVEAVNNLYKKGVVSGKADGVFAPNDYITRAEFTKILVNGLNIKDELAKSAFSDISLENWSYQYVATAEKYGIVKGSDGKFSPNSSITREDMAVMICRALDVADVDVKKTREFVEFSDDNTISTYAIFAVNTLYEYEIINGKGDNTFAPKAYATRAECAKMIYTIVGK